MADAMAQLKTHAVGEWEVVGDCFFAREALYDSMAWDDFDLEDKRVAIAPFGGPIAAVRDERRIVRLSLGASSGGPGGGGGAGAAGAGGLRPVLRTFTAAGAPLGAAVWEGGRLVELGWSEEVQLITVEANGKVTLFSPFCEKLREFTFGAAVERDGVAAAVLYGSGVLVLTEPVAAAAGGPTTPPIPGAIWVVSDLHDPRPVRLAAPPPAAFAAAAEAEAGAGGGAAAPPPGVLGLGHGGLGRPGLPSAVAVLPPRHTLSRGVEVLACLGSTLWLCDEASAVDHPLPCLRPGGAALLAASPEGAFVAALTRGGEGAGGGAPRLVVLSADLSRVLTEVELQAEVEGAGGEEGGGGPCPPSGLAWVGSDALLLTWPGAAVLAGPHGDTASWELAEGLAAVVSEVDGCRLLLGGRGGGGGGGGRMELLRRVPDACAQVFRPGATGPAAQLWDARALYDEQNPRCDRLLRGIQDGGPACLAAAVAACATAAGHDLAPPRQRALMRAAAFGRPFCGPSFPRQLMYGTACRLRILNALRDPRVGLPLTAAQLEALSLPVLVARLIAYRQWLLAYRIAGALRHVPGGAGPPGGAAAASAASGPAGPGGPGAAGPGGPGTVGPEAVLLQWACAKISAASAGGAAVDDERLKDSIVAKLKGCPGVRYAPLAAHALSVGRKRLALRLLEEERSAALQVPLLLKLATGGVVGQGQGGRAGARVHAPLDPGDEEGEGAGEAMQRALRKAVESGDTDLVYLVLFGLYRALPLPEFWALVAARALARNLFIKYCRAKEPELLETILTAASTGAGTPGGPQPSSSAAAAAAAAFPPAAAAAELAGMQLRAALAAEVAAGRAAAAAGGAAGGSGGGEAAAAKFAAALMDVSAKYGQAKDCAFQAKAVAELAALRREQARLEREAGQSGVLVGRSLVDTIRQAIRLGHPRAAAALKKQFGVTERRFAWIKVRTLAEARDWESLEGYASELKRSPIGFEPFVEAAKQWNAPLDYKARLIARLPDSPAKAEEFSALGLAREAAEVAARIKDSDLFTRIQSAVAAGSPAALAIAQLREKLGASFR
ncbi:hypothetical protein HYH03_009904 [Edaphochlamys debaryana]|uniref:Protein VACUOLELESS1 n=1 Tax=Edaphochlamys debaryana TaxID=47281 RepID=A0A836BWI2_9CHLO|nr:hypothetical protein HYH03_009904 [Edaphochlamys debaryana]|eukprot:KAG2491741.1 hypothetical protein HYH03_009904 [Edaphochlamys debaryana]